MRISKFVNRLLTVQALDFKSAASSCCLPSLLHACTEESLFAFPSFTSDCQALKSTVESPRCSSSSCPTSSTVKAAPRCGSHVQLAGEAALYSKPGMSSRLTALMSVCKQKDITSWSDKGKDGESPNILHLGPAKT